MQYCPSTLITQPINSLVVRGPHPHSLAERGREQHLSSCNQPAGWICMFQCLVFVEQWC